MLNLNRKVDQSVLVGEGVDMVKVKVLRVTPLHDGNYDVKLGFDAPGYISVDREEVRERRVKTIAGAFDGNRR